MLIEINDDTVDAIFKSTFIQDYKNLLSQHAELTQKLVTSPLKQFELEDLNDTGRWIEGMEIMMEYYIGHDWKETI